MKGKVGYTRGVERHGGKGMVRPQKVEGTEGGTTEVTGRWYQNEGAQWHGENELRHQVTGLLHMEQ